jgi:hypothetical protein
MKRPTKGSAVSRPPARHQKPPRPQSERRSTADYRPAPDPRPSTGRPGAHARHSKQAPAKSQPKRIAAALAGSTLLAGAAVPVVAHWSTFSGHPTGLDQANAALGSGPLNASAGLPGQSGTTETVPGQYARFPLARANAAQVAAARRAAAARRVAGRHAATQPSPQQSSPQPQATASSAYRNPLRAVGDLVLERVDMGVDFGGAGPVYALGDGVITNATGDSSGWPGGGWITYRLTDGPDAGLVVYVAEDVTPTVQVGQTVNSSTVIANMFNGDDGIETGWATSDGSTAESEMPEAGSVGGNGPFPSMVGLSFEAVLESLGVPAAPNAGQPGNGLLPAGYPAT